ncbi:hypothetical protein BKA64DRAFT_640095 [Cadophora sp. MPI-SDFR-AT-0126]|nr:hypothetical protein BKA64DRAFT_640095 [Leotiomycetes sp. MPI-SDFR-AT-0126]
MNTALQTLQAALALPWTDITFIAGLILLYSRVMYWMERDDEFLYIEEILAHVYLVFLVLFCGFAWLSRSDLADMQLDFAPWIKYGTLVMPAMAYEIVTKWAILGRVTRPGEMNDPFKVQYAVSIIFVVFCWTYLSNIE